jgi:hypothetical protein
MSLNWRTVRASDVEQACSLVETGQQTTRVPAKGIFLIHNGRPLPAKHVLRLAYCIANKLPLDSQLKFASGDSSINLLRSLGFEVERRGTPGEPKAGSALKVISKENED